MQDGDRRTGFHWMWIGLAVMFILIGAGVFISSVFRPAATNVTMMQFPFDFGWIWGLVGLFFVIWVFSWAFGGAWGHSRRYYRRNYWYRDEAHDILRERYARGEITREQFDQMTRDLEQHAQV